MHFNIPFDQLSFFVTAIKSLDFLLNNKTFQNIFGKIKLKKNMFKILYCK